MKKSFKDILLYLLYFFSTFIVVSIISFILIYIFKNGFSSINKEFIFGKPKGMPLGKEGGVFPAILGSLSLTFISLISASILGISTAIYISLYSKNKKINNFMHVVISSISGVPSIVLGLFGYSFLVYFLDFKVSLLSGGITLGIMIFPYIEVICEKAIEEVDKTMILSSYALGIDKFHTFINIILPSAKDEIISAIMLSAGFAMGATAPIMLTSAVISAPNPNSLFSPVMALPYHLYILISQGISMEKAYGTAFILIFILVVLNLFSLIFSKKKER
ncbi:phosphate ABC transporter permease PstA [Clostridium oceanicum]|uniref:Phosphate transport system permease protein PstA n=1 Tax=Clostridium oceanicum TaxID=1543 RepID=A0ABP3UZ73_9CLOT